MGSTAEYDTYTKWVASRQYRVELCALLLSSAPTSGVYDTAAQIVSALDTPPNR